MWAKKQKLFFQTVFMAFLLCVYAIGQNVYAQSAADEPCDPKYYESLKARAWLEAQREITQNQNLIFKPDSVLEYTCFDLYSAELAQHAIDMFSETTRWGTLLGADSMDKALEALVGTAFRSYLTSNFELSDDGPYDLLGGRLTDGGRDDAPSAQPDEGQDYDSSTWMPEIVGGIYTCDLMKKVWMKAKCMNLIDNADEDGFFTFTEYQNDEDKRFLPERCDKVTRWQQERDTATENTPWTEDDMKTYMEYLNNGTCGNSNQAAFPTGLIVRNKSHSPYLEKICIQPGCHYKPSNGSGSAVVTTGSCVSS